jgi:DNA-binding beta-propeller fold protein YncE
MSYTEYLRRKEAAAPKVIDTTVRLDASSYTQRVKFASSRVLNETNLKAVEPVDVLPTVTTLAGHRSLPGNVDSSIPTDVRFSQPYGMCIDPAGLNLYVADKFNYKIRKTVIATGQTTTLAGIGTAGTTDGAGLTVAQFTRAMGICIDPAGLNLYVTEITTHRIRKIVIATGEVSTFAGSTVGYLDGFGTAAQFNFASDFTGIIVDPSGTNLYVTDRGNNKIRKIVISTGQVSTFAGTTLGNADGAGLTVAQFNNPFGITIDPTGTDLYVIQTSGTRIRKIVIATAVVSSPSFLQSPEGIVVDPTGTNIYITAGQIVRKIVISTSQATTLAGAGIQNSSIDGDGIGTNAIINDANSICIDPLGLNLYILDSNRIRKIAIPYTYFQTNIPINKAKTGGRIADASTFTQYTGGQAVGKEVQAGMPARRLLLNSNSAGSLTGCRIVPEPVPYNPAVGGVYSANMVRRDASQFTRDGTACRQLTGEPHNRNELGPSLFVDNTIVGVKNYNLPQNNSKTYTATKCTQCGNNGSQLAKTCSFCIGANHLHPADKPTNNRWGPRPKKSAQPIIVNQSPSDFHKVGAAMRKIPYVEKHHGNDNIGRITYPKTPYRIPRGTAAQLKINDPQRYPGTM